MTAFRTIVDKHFWLISRSLLEKVASQSVTSPQAADNPVLDRHDPRGVTVPTDLVVGLGAGCVLVDRHAPPSPVFHVYRKDGAGTFAYDRTIAPGDAARNFVYEAYEAILRRRADESGSKSYVTALERGVLTREDILRMLASSDEARALGLVLLIVPQTSPWLSHQATFPRTLILTTEAFA